MQEASPINRLMEHVLFPLAEKLWPNLREMTGQKRLIGAGEVLTFVYAAPLALIGLAWLVASTRLENLRQYWPLLLLMGALMFLFRKVGFFMIQEIRAGRYASSDGSMDSMILWAAVFLTGPGAVWLGIGLALIDFIWRRQKAMAMIDRWNRLRNFAFYIASTTLGTLISLQVYSALGGELPLASLSPRNILAGLAALAVHFGLVLLVWLGYMLYAMWTQTTLLGLQAVTPILRFLLTALGLPNLAHPFAILLAGLYMQNGPLTFFFFLFGLLLVAILARQLSWAAENSRQRARQLEKLEGLSRAILEAPPDASMLPELLQAHVPLMFPSGRVAMWVDNDHILLQHPDDWLPEMEILLPWLLEQHHPQAFLAHETLPWYKEATDHNAVVVTPIHNAETGDVMGGVYLEVYGLVSPWDMNSLQGLFPALSSLGGQVASALRQAEVYEQALAYHKISQELTLAGKIQSSFLPDELPDLTGWQLAVTLLPARETSGDFFDLIPLQDGKFGILIADVTDKGVGAALYMALSRTLIRTYAIEFDDDPQPDVVFFAANGRLLHDARANLFVTAFYGIFDPLTGSLTYCNAGHNPPYLLSNHDGEVQALPLKATGMPMGIEEEMVWSKQTVEFNPGDVLVMYTDGIPDAQNSASEFYGDERLVNLICASIGLPAHEIQTVLLDDVQDFVANAPQFDDITLMVVARDPLEAQPEDSEQREEADAAL